MEKPNRIDMKTLAEMVEKGHSGQEIAAFFGVSAPAVSRARARLDKALVIDAATRTAPMIADEKIDAIGQLKKISRAINSELDAIERELQATKGIEEKEALRKQKIAHAAEVRKQVNLMVYIASQLYQVEEVSAFQQTVLEVIGEVDEEIRKKILTKLRQKLALRRAIEFS